MYSWTFACNYFCLHVASIALSFNNGCMQIGEIGVSNPAAEQDHVFMPAFPLCRDLPTFEANSSSAGDGEQCSKFHRLHNQLTPGIFTLFCAHGVCLGFKLMANKEGPAMAFDLLFTRFQKGEATCGLILTSMIIVASSAQQHGATINLHWHQ